MASRPLLPHARRSSGRRLHGHGPSAPLSQPPSSLLYARVGPHVKPGPVGGRGRCNLVAFVHACLGACDEMRLLVHTFTGYFIVISGHPRGLDYGIARMIQIALANVVSRRCSWTTAVRHRACEPRTLEDLAAGNGPVARETTACTSWRSVVWLFKLWRFRLQGTEMNDPVAWKRRKVMRGEDGTHLLYTLIACCRR